MFRTKHISNIWLLCAMLFVSACKPNVRKFFKLDPPPGPTLSTVTPTTGPVSGGTTITLGGKDFTSSDTVKVGLVACSNIVFVSDTSLTCVTPAVASSGAVDVSVTNSGGQTSTLTNGFTYIPSVAAPQISGLNPIAGPLAGGTTITITGAGFQSGATVAIGGTTCGSVVFTSETEISCVTAAKAAGTYSIVVTNLDTQSATQLNAFTYQPAPTVTTVSPTFGALIGGNNVTLTGTGFMPGATVSFGGTNCVGPAIASTMIICAAPAGAAGTVDITVTNTDGQSGTKTSAYTYVGPPTLASVSPNGGPLLGGTSITLTGTGFITGATVSVGGAPCASPSVSSATTMTCTTAPHAAGAVSVVITNPDNQSATLTNAFTYQPGPTLTSLSPTAGALAGGTTITLTGSNFLTGATVKVGGTTCTSPQILSATSMTCVTPAHAAGAYDVIVTNTDTQASSLTNGYTYQPAPAVSAVSPIAGPLAGNTTLDITGTNFLANATVTIGGTNCNFPNVVSATQMTCITAAKVAGTYDVVVRNFDAQTGTKSNGYTYQPAPTITSISPSAGALAGGTTITITGTTLLSGATVTVGGNNCSSVSVISATSLTCVTAAHIAGSVTATVTNFDNQTGSLANAYTYQAAPIVTSVSPPAGGLIGSTYITITGSNFLAGATASIGGTTCTVPNLVSSTSLQCFTPAKSAGVYDVAVTNADNQTGTLINGFTYQVAPTVTSVSPTAGALTGNTAVTVTGTGFLTGAAVIFGGANCGSVVVVSPTQITCNTPSHVAGLVDIVVANTDTQTGTLSNAYLYQGPPVASSVSPTGGALAGGTTITITGSNFLVNPTVSLDGVACTSVNRVSATQITCVTPAHVAGAVDIVVANNDSQTATMTAAYTYQAAPDITLVTPSAGALGGGTQLNVTGTGFLSGMTATLGGSTCTSPNVISVNQFTCLTPAKSAGQYDLVVTNFDGQNDTQTNAYNYQPAPTVTAISPNFGPAAGGTSVTVTGTNFIFGVTVQIDGNECTSPVLVTGTTITCTTPAGSAGAKNVTVTNADTQAGTATNLFTYVPAPTISSSTPNAGALAGGTTIILTGTGFQNGATAKVGGNTCTSPNVISATQMSCVTAAHAAGAVDIVVTNADAQTGTLTNGYTFQAAPSVTSASPIAGALAGGTTITITGTNFQSGATVLVGGVACTSPTVNTTTNMTCITGAHTAGTFDVTVTNTDTQFGTLTNGYTYQAAPSVTSINPTAGALGGGTAVTITGTDFINGANVLIGGATCAITLTTPTQITCTTGVGTAGVKNVVVTNPDNQSGTLTNGYTYQAAPVILLVTPNAGALAGGTTVTLTGSGFLAGLGVTFDGTPCTSMNVVSLTSATCVTPAHAAATVDLVATNTDTQTTTKLSGYTYQAAPTITSVSPIAGALEGGTALTVNGTNFRASAVVTIGGNVCTSPTVVNATKITCTTSSNVAGTYDVVVTNTDNQAATLTNGYTYQPPPTVSSITPNAGAIAGGTTITIVGTGFLGGIDVKIGGVACTNISTTATLLTCDTPAGTAGPKDVKVTNFDNQNVTYTNGYTYQFAPTLTVVAPTAGSINGGTAVTITGTHFVAGASVDFGGSACTSVNVVNATTITCNTPAHAAGDVDVFVMNADTQTSNTVTNAYRFQPAPSITTIAPSAGKLGGGTTITITGTGFLAGIDVKIGTIACVNIVVGSPTQITCDTPNQAAGTYNVVVTNTDSQTNTKTNGYTYQAAPTVTSVSPNTGFVSGQYTLTITGTGYKTGATVEVGGVACSNVSVQSLTSLTCLAPLVANAGVVNVKVSNADTQNDTLSNGFTYTLDGFVTLSTVAGIQGNSNTDGTGTAARMGNSLYGIANDGTNVYVADSQYCVIRKVVISTQATTTLAGTAGNCVAAAAIADGTGASATFAAPTSAFYTGGFLYIGDAYTIRKVNVSTGAVTTVAGAAGTSGTTNDTGTAARFGQTIGGLTADATYLYIGDTSNHMVRQMNLSTSLVGTLAGSGVAGSDNLSGTSATFSSPRGLATDGTSVYVADSGNHLIRKITIAGAGVATYAGTGANAELDGAVGSAKFSGPYSLYLTPTFSHLFVVDYTGGYVRKIDLTGNTVSTVTGKNPMTRNDIGTAAYFAGPMAITGDGTFMYITDRALASVRKHRISNNLVTTLAGQINQFGTTNGTGTAALFYDVQQPTILGTLMYVPDRLNCQIRAMVLSTTAVTLFAGNSSGTCSTTSAAGTGTNAFFYNPAAMTNDGTYLYVADGRTIRQIDLDTNFVATLTGQIGSSGQANGNAATATFGGDTYGIAADGTYVYVTDYNNHVIRKVDASSGSVTTLAGTMGVSGSTNDLGTAASFNHPTGMVMSTDKSKLWVADSGNCLIREVTIATGNVTTVAGGAGVCSHLDQTGTNARFNNPIAITSDGATYLFVYDLNSNNLRKITISSGAVTTLVTGQVSGNPYHADLDATISGGANTYSPNSLLWSNYGMFVTNAWNIRRFQ